ncbi:MAG: transposase, partial [Nocardioides sp.]|nr:transposase [Nocardioides sp.]
WLAFFRDLTARDLSGVKLVTSDAHGGLTAAIAATLAGAAWQRCRTHYAAHPMSATPKLFLNHHTIEPLADVFGMGSTPFRTLTCEFRRRVTEEAAAAEVTLILTMVWNLGGVEDARWVEQLVELYANAGLPISLLNSRPT